jgi:hypothetical protein
MKKISEFITREERWQKGAFLTSQDLKVFTQTRRHSYPLVCTIFWGDNPTNKKSSFLQNGELRYGQAKPQGHSCAGEDIYCHSMATGWNFWRYNCLRIESLQRIIIYRDKEYIREGTPTERNALAPSKPCPLTGPRSVYAGTQSYDDFLC